MAVLGLVAITEKDSPKTLLNNDKRTVGSVFDCLDGIRVTKLGAYCLSLLENYATPPQGTYEAIADKDLLIVTFRGTSLERKLFLDLIGNPLDLERYRIDRRSFVRGCAGFLDVQARIEKFKRLIDPDPSDRWKKFFTTLQDGVKFLDKRETAMLFYVGNNRTLLGELVAYEKLRALFYLTEGDRIVVPAQNAKKFVQLAKEEGYFANSFDD